MEPTPWEEYVTDKPTVFYFGYDHAGGFVVFLEALYGEEAWACRAAPGTPHVDIITLTERSRKQVPLYEFSLQPQTGEKQTRLLAHPFALAHLYAKQMMAPAEVMGIGARTSRDTFELRHPIDTPCLLTNMLRTPNVTLILSGRKNLHVL